MLLLFLVLVQVKGKSVIIAVVNELFTFVSAKSICLIGFLVEYMKDYDKGEFVKIACPCCGKNTYLNKVKHCRYKNRCERCGSILYCIRQSDSHFYLAVITWKNN